jgi:hypothetical protein
VRTRQLSSCDVSIVTSAVESYIDHVRTVPDRVLIAVKR